MKNLHIQKELATRALAKRSLKHFTLLKWERYEKKPFLDNWHYDYLCKILENTLPHAGLENNAGLNPQGLKHNSNQQGSNANTAQEARDKALESSNDKPPPQTPSAMQGDINSTNPTNAQTPTEPMQKMQTSQQHTNSKLTIENNATNEPMHTMQSYNAHNAKSQSQEINTTAPTPEQEHIYQNISQNLITRLMINMPPSYGKTEIIARCYIAWALGHYPNRKFFYISYSDDLCRKISNQVRDLLKSPFYATIFKTPTFLQDNANEFILKEGGGLFVTTLKSALTGFHAHQILIDDPIKVSEMNSKAERDKVNQNFKESVLSRLQDNQSNITILMQRLGNDDLCGFLLNEKHFTQETISQWQQVSLKAINPTQEIYKIGSYEYIRKEKTALFALRHTLQELETLKLQMGNDEFSTQYQQDPQVSEAGYFENVYFKTIPSYECHPQNLYIFVDNAISLNSTADNRAIVLIGVEHYKEAVRYVIRDCEFGIWDEQETINHLIDMMFNNPTAKVYIESEGGGLILERLLNAEIAKVNAQHKATGKNQIINFIKCYTPSRKIAKQEKIKALRPYYNTGYLVFLHNAKGLNQIKKELFSFNPEKPFRKDDCIDCIASAVIHNEIIPPRKEPPPSQHTPRHRAGQYYPNVWRV